MADRRQDHGTRERVTQIGDLQRRLIKIVTVMLLLGYALNGCVACQVDGASKKAVQASHDATSAVRAQNAGRVERVRQLCSVFDRQYRSAQLEYRREIQREQTTRRYLTGLTVAQRREPLNRAVRAGLGQAAKDKAAARTAVHANQPPRFCT